MKGIDYMRTIIHDVENPKKYLKFNKEDNVVDSRVKVTTCKGCFGCWVKTPGHCVIPDRCMNMGVELSKTDELVIISKCVYGSVSALVKKVIDRSISYAHPCFEVNGKTMRHKRRYNNNFKLKIIFYNVKSEQEKNYAESFCELLKRKFHANSLETKFLDEIREIEL